MLTVQNLLAFMFVKVQALLYGLSLWNTDIGETVSGSTIVIANIQNTVISLLYKNQSWQSNQLYDMPIYSIQI